MEGKLRLISNVSMVDEVVDRLLFGTQNNIEIANWDTLPSKPGIGFTDEMIKQIHDEVMERMKSHHVAEGDSSNWDWSVQGWELQAEADMRIKLYGLDPESLGARLIRNRIFCVSWSVFVMSNGRMFAQRMPGIMLSGWYNTSSSNSRIGRLTAVLAGALWSIHMGDDFLADFSVKFKEKFEALGHTLKLFKPIDPEAYEFCSTMYPSGAPVNIWKIFVKLINHEGSISKRSLLFEQWLYEMRNSPERDDIRSLLESSGFLQ
jgi:hypothetical protein